MVDTTESRAHAAERFEAVALPLLEILLRTARRITGERSVADDLVQETMLQAWRAFHQFEPGTNCKAWLFRIMVNLWSKLRRKQQPHLQAVPLDEVVTGRESRVQADLQVRMALDALPEEQRVVLMLGVVEGFTCKEIAEMLSLPIGTVMSRLSRGRARLRDALDESTASDRKVLE